MFGFQLERADMPLGRARLRTAMAA